MLRPPIPYTLAQSENAITVKFVDDVTAASSVNLLQNLKPDITERPRTLSKNEHTQQILPRDRNLLQVYLDSMEDFA